MLEEPAHALGKARQPVEHVLLEDLAREQRDEADHRAQADRQVLAVDVDEVVVEAVLLVPEADAAQPVNCVRDRDVVLEELRRDVLVRRILGRELEGDREHGAAVERHPRRAVRLLQRAPARERLGPVEHPDVVEAQEPAAEQVAALDVLAVDPPGEVEQQLLEDALEEDPVAPAARSGHLVDAPRRPGVHRRVDVVEPPLVCGQLAVRLHVPLAQEEHELALGGLGVEARQRQHVKRQVPRREPRVLPGVGHRQHVAGVDVRPVRVAPRQAGGRRRRLGGVAVEPLGHDQVVELLRPDQAGVRLARHRAFGGLEPGRDDGRVELVGLANAGVEGGVEPGAERLSRHLARGREAQAQRRTCSGRKREAVPGRRLRAGPGRVDGALSPADDAVVEGVLDERGTVRFAEQALGVGLVVGEQQFGRAAVGARPADQREPAERRVDGLEGAGSAGGDRGSGGVLVAAAPPTPAVAEPQRRKQVQRGRFRAAVADGDADEDVVGRRFGVLHLHVEEAVAVEDAGVGQLELRVAPRPRAVLKAQPLVRELGLRVLVQRLEVRGGRRAVEEEVGLLDVLAVVPLLVGEPEQALLQDRVAAVPERDREAQARFAVADAEQPVLPPTVGAAAGVVVGEVGPAVAVRGVVLAHGAPLPFGEVWPPPLPVPLARGVLGEAPPLRRW